ncbi:MAG: carbon-nitrogen family hydrolase [Syntrophomonas sp.]
MKVAILQLAFNEEESKAARISRVERILDQAAGTDLVLLPEVWNIGYYAFDQYKAESETLNDATVTRLAAKAGEHGMYIFAGSFIERDGNNLYNGTVLLDRKGEICGHYRKIHLFGIGSEERKYLSPGNKVTVCDTDFGKVGLSICYDLRFPELHRRMAAEGAEFILSCAAWSYPRVENWLVLNQARAIENQCFYLTCGCAGTSQGKGFIGRSMAVDPWGNVVTSAGDRETILRCEINPGDVAECRAQLSFLKDRVQI